MLGYLSLVIICSWKITVFFELHSQETVRFLEHNVYGQISKHICTPNGGYYLFIQSFYFD